MPDLPACPSSVAVIGGGRWARVLLDVLCALLPPEVVISVHTRGNAGGMEEWANSKGLSGRLRVSPKWPRFAETGAVIVANAARDHEEAVALALKAGRPTLVEKPIAPTGAEAERLTALAAAHGARFAASQVSMFARYIDLLSRRVKEAGALESIDIVWSDAKGEERYGESKRYDATLPVSTDVLPHIAGIVVAVAGRSPDSCRSVRAERGGALVVVELAAGVVPVFAHMERDAERRVRVVRARAGGRQVTLDFSSEPGTLTSGGRAEDADPLWGSAPRPLARMLTAFLTWAAGGPADPRLDPATGVQACRLADQVSALLR